MFASLNYIQNHHAYASIPNQPDMNPHSSNSANPSTTNGNTNGDSSTAQNDPNAPPEDHVPDSKDVFQSALRELARDLVIKEQQIEYLVSVLPGIGNSEADQNAMIQALEVELRKLDAERTEAKRDRDQMLNLLGELAAHCKRVY